jgi:hypothetical protein
MLQIGEVELVKRQRKDFSENIYNVLASESPH